MISNNMAALLRIASRPKMPMPDHWWRGEDNALDSAGTAHGTWTGTAAYADGKIGRCFSFGGESKIDTTARPNATADGITFAVWFKAAESNTFRTILDSGGNLSSQNGYLIRLTDAGLLQFFVGGTASGGTCFSITTPAGTRYDDNAWHHCACTWTGTTEANGVRVYVDGGAAKAQGTAAYASTALLIDTDMTIGGRSDTTFRWSGLLDEVKIYDRTLTQSQINRLAGA
jgi:hypothetical protein